MRFIIAVILWCILFSISWPLALGLFFILAFAWLILLPFRIVGFTLEVVFRIVRGILLFPFMIFKKI